MLVRRMYCLKDKRIVEHEFESRYDLDDDVMHMYYTCLNCGIVNHYERKLWDEIDDESESR